jgi:ankyrin repeat protein
MKGTTSMKSKNVDSSSALQEVVKTKGRSTWPFRGSGKRKGLKKNASVESLVAPVPLVRLLHGRADKMGLLPCPFLTSFHDCTRILFQADMPVVAAEITPQTCLNTILESRGYSVTAFRSLDSAYYNETPSSTQLASYGGYLLYVLRAGDTPSLRSLMEAGLDPNACNQDCEYLVHHAGRWGQLDCLRTLLDCGAELQVADSYGRTPLHNACFAENPCFALVELMLKVDIHLLFMADARGKLPLSYVPKDRQKHWIQFFMSKKEQFWPQRVASKRTVDQQNNDDVPPLALLQPNMRQIADPKTKIPDTIAVLLADRKMTIEEAKLLNYLCLEEDQLEESLARLEEFSNNNGSVTFREDDLAMILSELGVVKSPKKSTFHI